MECVVRGLDVVNEVDMLVLGIPPFLIISGDLSAARKVKSEKMKNDEARHEDIASRTAIGIRTENVSVSDGQVRIRHLVLPY